MSLNKDKEEYNNLDDILEGSKKDFQEYLNNRLTLLKLRSYEKIANFSSRLLLGVVLAFLFLIFCIITVITLALFLSYMLDNYTAGFGITILILIFSMVFVFTFKRFFRRFFTNLTLRIIKKIESDED